MSYFFLKEKVAKKNFSALFCALLYGGFLPGNDRALLMRESPESGPLYIAKLEITARVRRLLPVDSFLLPDKWALPLFSMTMPPLFRKRRKEYSARSHAN